MAALAVLAGSKAVLTAVLVHLATQVVAGMAAEAVAVLVMDEVAQEPSVLFGLEQLVHSLLHAYLRPIVHTVMLSIRLQVLIPGLPQLVFPKFPWLLLAQEAGQKPLLMYVVACGAAQEAEAAVSVI